MVVVESVFHHCLFVRLSKPYVLVVLLCSGLCRSPRLSDVYLATLTGYALLQLHSRRLDQDTYKACPLTPHFILLVARGPEVSKGAVWLNAAACKSQWRRTSLGKTLWSAAAASALAIRSATADMRALCVASGEYHISGKCCTPKQQVTCCSSGGNNTANYQGCVKWKDAKAVLAKYAPVDCSKGSSTPSHPAMPGESSGALRRAWEPGTWLEPHRCVGAVLRLLP